MKNSHSVAIIILIKYKNAKNELWIKYLSMKNQFKKKKT